MPTRPVQHELEDISRAKFQLAIPSRWVFRDKNKDYGIDGEVELFDESKKAQGIFFLVQLKATGSKSESIIMNVDLSIETLLYYKKLDTPVLLVRYSEHQDSIYIKWVNNVDLFYSKEKSKTYRIKLTKNDKWDTNSAEKIEERLINVRKLKFGYFNFPIPISFIFKDSEINKSSKGVFTTQLRSNLKQFSEYVEFDSNSSVIQAIFDKKELKVSICDLCGCSFHGIDTIEKDKFINTISQKILLGLAVSLVQIGQIEYTSRIIFENNLQETLVEEMELLLYLLPPLFQTSYIEKVLDLADKILENAVTPQIAIMITTNVLIASKMEKESKNNIVEKFLQNRLKNSIKIGNNTLIGSSHYNLGNYYRNRGMFYKSIQHYVVAKRFEPIYLKQHYYCGEIAAVLFLSERFYLASKFYLKSIELGAPCLTKALYADALLFSGEYEKAKIAYFDYLECSKNPPDAFQLKAICIDTLLENKKIKVQKRNYIDAIILADSTKYTKGSNNIIQLEKALELDLLSGLAWYNLGISYSENEEYNDASFCFTMAGLVQTNDIEAWKNATLCLLREKSEIELLPLIIRTAFHFNGDDYLEILYSHLEKTANTEDVAPIIDMIEELLPEKENNESLPTIRMLNKDEIFKNIFEH